MKLIAAVLITLLAGFGYAAETPPAVQPPNDAVHRNAGVAKMPPDVGNVKVPKATGPDARTVAEIVAKGADLKDKPVSFAARS